VSSAFIAAYEDRLYPQFTNLSLFAQDTWRASARMTVTYGLRWEYNPPPSDRDGRVLPTITGLDEPATMRLAPEGTPLWDAPLGSFAPRFGIAYQLSTRPGSETTIRGGAGRFYDLTPGQIGEAYGVFTYPYNASRFAPNTPYPLLPEVAAPPLFGPENVRAANIAAFEPNLRLPYATQWNVTVDRALGSAQTVTASYVAALGRRLYETEFYFAPNPHVSEVILTRGTGTSTYHALQVQVQRRLSRGLQALASYTLAESTDTNSQDSSKSLVPAGQRGGEINRGPSDFDVRHAFSAAFTYSPAWNPHGWLRAFGGWSVDAVFRALSATPVDVTSQSVGGSVSIANISVRPDVVPGVPMYIDDPSAPGGRRFNRDAFVARNDTHGTLERNTLRGFPMSQLDMTVRQDIPVGGSRRVQLRLDVFNVFNRANFANPVGTLTSSQFGVSTQMLNRGLGGLNGLYQIGGPRSAQLGIKFVF
jgi:hypothetical protein